MANAVADGAREAILTNLMHFGLITVGLPHSFQSQMRLDEITGGSLYGATVAGRLLARAVGHELAGARLQGRQIAQIANKLFG